MLSSLADDFIFQKSECETRESAVLDLNLTNMEGLVEKVKALGTLGRSGHILLGFKILQKEKSKHSNICIN